MTAGDEDEQQGPTASRGVPRRALLGGALTAAAAGIVGYEVGAAGASGDDDGGGGSTGAADAREVAVVPEGELVADDVQAALVDVYGRTSALARLEDLRVAYELVDDFPPVADRVGALGWTTATSGAGASVEQAAVEGGVVQLSTGTSATGRAAIHLGLGEHVAAPVFTMQWRLAMAAVPDPAQPTVLAFGALASVTADPATADVGPAMLFVHDPAVGPNWICRVVQEGKAVDVDSKRGVNQVPHRFTITSDGDGLARFAFDGDEVGSIPVDKTGTERYGQGLVLAKTGGTDAVTVAVDWFYLRRELPR